MLTACESRSVAVPSVIFKIKSLVSKSPLPPLVLKTGSLIETNNELLFEEMDKPLMTGGVVSFRVTTLLS